jgi:zinc protease
MRPALSRYLLGVSAAALLASAALPAFAFQADAATPVVAQVAAPGWPQATSDVAADPAVRFGQLPNGMRYAIMRNATPPNQAALRFNIDAGSLAENDEQQGLAHFLEHMAFNGSTNIPEGEMTRRLERLGMAFGGDTNAFTSFDQTAYTLNLPNTSAEVVETALMVLRETASELLFDPEAVDRERGVVVGEERTRDTPDMRSIRALLSFVAPGQRIADRLPIGDLDIIRTAPRQRFVDFYEAYYRPERATMIAVGDFDVDTMEAQIRAAFSDWTNNHPAGPDPDTGVVQPRQAETYIHVEPGAQSSLQLMWTSDADRRPDSVAKRAEASVLGLGLAVLNRRINELTRLENPPFIGGGAGQQTLYDSLDLGLVMVAFNPGGWARAIETAEQEVRRLTEYGVDAAELQREITQTRTALENAVAGAATRQTPGLAGGLLSAVNDDQVFTSPASQLERFDAVVASVTVDEVNAALRANFSGNGPLAFVTTPVAIDGGAAAITAVLEASQQVAVSPPAVTEAMEWPYTDFGAAAQPSGQTVIDDLGATLVTFPNGVRLTVKPTTFTDDQILVSVRAGNGQLDLPRDRLTPVWSVQSAFSEGGLGQLTRAQLEQVLTGKVVGATMGTAEDAFEISGATRPADFQTQLQLLAAYFTDAAWRPEPFALIKSMMPTYLEQLAATPGGAFSRYGTGLLASGDARFATPSADDIASAQLSEARDVVSGSIATGPVEVVIVGDVTVEDAIAAVSSTFGALPARAPAVDPTAQALDVRFPAGVTEPVRLHHTGLPTQALGYVAWPTVDSVNDRKEARIVNLMSQVLQLRVTDELRENQGVAYSPRAGASSSTVFPDYGYAFIQIETPPEALDGFFETADEIAAGLRDAPVSEDELSRARLSTIESIRRGRATNGYWLGALEGAHDKPARVEAVRTVLSDLEAVTPADIQRAAQTYLLPERAWRATVTAEAARPAE